MLNLRSLLFLLSVLFVFSVTAIAQNPPPAMGASEVAVDRQTQKSFVSLEGEFSIALPELISGYKGFQPTDDVKSGRQFQWQTPSGNFVVAFQERLSISAVAPGEYVENLTRGVVKKMEDTAQGEFISKRHLLLDGNSGEEVLFRLKSGAISIIRYYVVRERLYILQAIYTEKEDGSAQKTILDTFKLIDAKTILAQKVAEATPAPLPQSPATEKKRSDAQDDRLTGKIKSVTEESAEISAAGEPVGRMLSSIEEYDEKGGKLKQILYDYRGNPFDITVFGFIDGARVSKSKSIRYEYDPPPLAVKTAATENTKRDSRYELKYEYQYVNGRITEEKFFGNDDSGIPFNRRVYNYQGNQLEELTYNKQGRLSQKFLTDLDDKGNEIEKTFFDLSEPQIYGNKKYLTVYNSFDDQGNWIKKTVSVIETKDGKEISKPSYITYRTMIYYP